MKFPKLIWVFFFSLQEIYEEQNDEYIEIFCVFLKKKS